jgi:hypothetical protein
MSAEETRQVPLLRSARGGDFTFLRPGNPFHEIAVSQFGSRLNLVQLVFRKDQVEKVARLVRRRRRQSSVSSGGNRTVGRPSHRHLLRTSICQIIEAGRWNSTMPLKALAQLARRSSKCEKGLSEATVTRTLDWIFEETKDRRFERVRRKPRNAN